MKKIKFRYWDPFNEEMYVCQDDNLEGFFKRVEILNRGGNNLRVMQFTGFTDSKGVEIYEGDTLGEWNLIDGEMEMSMRQVYWCENTGAWMLDSSFKQEKSTGDLLSDELFFGYEVIGNIYTK
jgi:hypothetical protein